MDKNECGKTNEAKITSKSSYQISVAAIESDANVKFHKHQQRLNHFSLMSIESELLRKQNFDKLMHEIACKKARKILL